MVATHGRGFWILDDVSPLRQFDDDVAKKDVHLYAPAPAYFRNCRQVREVKSHRASIADRTEFSRRCGRFTSI